MAPKRALRRAIDRRGARRAGRRPRPGSIAPGSGGGRAERLCSGRAGKQAGSGRGNAPAPTRHLSLSAILRRHALRHVAPGKNRDRPTGVRDETDPPRRAQGMSPARRRDAKTIGRETSARSRDAGATRRYSPSSAGRPVAPASRVPVPSENPGATARGDRGAGRCCFGLAPLLLCYTLSG